MAGDDIEKIKDRLSINEVVGQYVTLKRAGRNWAARCPFHNEKTPSFYISPERGTYMCFGCGEHGDIFSFVQKIEGIDFPTALRQLAEKAGVVLGRQAAPNPALKEKDERLREACEEAVKFFESTLAEKKDVRDYLHSRGVHDDTIATWRLGYAPAAWEELSKHLAARGFTKDEAVEAGFAVRSAKTSNHTGSSPDASEASRERIFDRFRGRIIFPLFDTAGRPAAVSGRFFEKVPGQKGDVEPAKYVNSPETPLFKKSKMLYGLDRAKGAIRKADCILLVEGQFDVVLAHQSGLPFTVALSGTALTHEHLSLLGRLSKRLVLALDADQAGVRAGLKSASMAIAAGFDVKVPQFPPGKDPADVARENPELLKSTIRTSKVAVEFFMDALRPLAKDARAYAKLAEASVLPLIVAMGSHIEQEQAIRLVAGKLGVSEAAVRVEAAKVQTSPGDGGDTASASPSTQLQGTDSITGFEGKVGMLLFRFGKESPVGEKLAALLGEERLREVEEALAPRAEELRFRFEAQVHEDTTQEAIVADMLEGIERVVEKERLKMKFL